MADKIIAWIILIAISSAMFIIAFAPVYFEWKDERAARASRKYCERFGGEK